MKLRPERLAGQLARGLAPIYLITGDEPLQLAEASDMVRDAARAQGFSGREVFSVESGFDWSRIAAAVAGELSLFAERRLVELRLPGGKPGDSGGKALRAWAENPPPDTILMIIAPRIDAAAQRSRWFRALEQAGVVVQIWPLGRDRLPGWIQQRMRARGLRASQEAVALLAERVEGNLLAAAQEIEKLHLLYGDKQLGPREIAAAVADSARFNIYELVDSALSGDAARAVRTLRGVRGEGVEPVLVLWALSREIRLLEEMAGELESGAAPQQVMGRHRVWEQRRPLVRKGLERHPRRRWQQLLRHAARIDRVIKGAARGDAWDELLQLVLAISGRPLFRISGDGRVSGA